MSSFYIDLSEQFIGTRATELGFTGANWRTDLLNDLLFDQQLKAAPSSTASGRPTYELLGRTVQIRVEPHPDLVNTLACSRVKQATPTALRSAFLVPGPWDFLNKNRKRKLRASGPGSSVLAQIQAAHDQSSEAAPDSPRPPSSEAEPTDQGLSPQAQTTAAKPQGSPDTPSKPVHPHDRAPDQSSVSTAPQAPDPPVQVVPSETAAAPSDDTGLVPDSDSLDEATHSLGRPLGTPEVMTTAETWNLLAADLVARSIQGTGDLLGDEDPLAARDRLETDLKAQIEALEARLHALPSERVVRTATKTRDELASAGCRVLPSPPPQLAVESVTSLIRTLGLLEEGLQHHLPRWSWGEDPSSHPSSIQPASILESHEASCFLREAHDWIRDEFGGQPPPRLRELPAPTTPGTPLQRLVDAWAADCSIDVWKERLDAPAIQVLVSIPVSQRTVVAERLLGWSRYLAPAAYSDLLAQVARASNCTDEPCPDWEPILVLDERDRAMVQQVPTFDLAASLIARFIPRSEGGAAPLPRRRPERGQLSRFDHVISDQRGIVTAATVVVPEPVAGDVAVRIAMPVRLVASAPLLDSLPVSVESTALHKVPTNVKLPQGWQLVRDGARARLEGTLQFPRASWQQAPGEPAFAEVTLLVPVTLEGARKLRTRELDRIRLQIEHGDKSHSLTFERFVPGPPVIGDFEDKGRHSDSMLVEEQPLGVQRSHTSLEATVRNASEPFLVVAPRRFGKSTLLRHLAEVARKEGHTVVNVLLTRSASPTDAAREVWREIRAHVNRRFNCAPAFPDVHPADLDQQDLWSKLQQFLHERGSEALVVLIDEAQTLIPPDRGVQWGDAFKRMFDAYLGQAQEGHARVQIALFGTMDLSVRLGPNCRQALLQSGVKEIRFHEDDLARYLRRVSEGRMQSSRPAREALVRWSSNLWTLRQILERISDRISHENRQFFLAIDVERAVGEVLDRDFALSQELWGYARSELSHTDDWEPVDSFPVAVAWARESSKHLPLTERKKACARWLNSQLQQIEVKAVVLEARFNRALQDLIERGVLSDDHHFVRPLLERLLNRNAAALRSDARCRELLVQLAVDAVRLPDNLPVEAEGAQARVYRYDDGQVSLAYRVCTIDSDDARRRFARTCAAVRLIKNRSTARAGDEYLPRVQQAGFREGHPSEGVLVYRWIEGTPLTPSWEQMQPARRVAVGLRVARALSALHARDVIHCDVAPQNILVDDNLRVWLIDFGLARRTLDETRTRLTPDLFKAPEQVHHTPRFYKASDVYALGVLLRGKASGDDLPKPVAELVNRMTLEDHRDRPDISAVVEHLERAGSLDFKLHAELAARLRIADQAPRDLVKLLRGFAPHVTYFEAGLHELNVQELEHLAHMIQAVFVRSYGMGRTLQAQCIQSLSKSEVTLSRVASDAVACRVSDRLRPWCAPEVKAVGLLRNAYAHEDNAPDLEREARHLLRISTDTQVDRFQAAARDVVQKIDQHLIPGGRSPLTRFFEPYWRPV